MGTKSHPRITTNIRACSQEKISWISLLSLDTAPKDHLSEPTAARDQWNHKNLATAGLGGSALSLDIQLKIWGLSRFRKHPKTGMKSWLKTSWGIMQPGFHASCHKEAHTWLCIFYKTSWFLLPGVLNPPVTPDYPSSLQSKPRMAECFTTISQTVQGAPHAICKVFCIFILQFNNIFCVSMCILWTTDLTV